MSELKKLYFVNVDNDDVGEVEGFFDERGSHLASWSVNDASWRGEYMNRLLQALGFAVVAGTKNHEEKLIEIWS